MVTVLEGADFKANNIGRIILPIAWDSDALSFVTALSVQPNETKQRAINTFVKSLKREGIWAKTTKIHLLTLGHDDATKNLKNPTQVITLPTDAAIATYDKFGANFLKGWAGTFSLPSRADFHLGFYNAVAIVSTDDVTRTGLAFGSSDVRIGRRVTTGKTAGVQWNTTLLTNVIPNRMNSAGAMIASSKASVTKTVACVNGEISATAQAYVAGSTNTPVIMGASLVDNTSTLLTVPISLLTMGSFLTEVELPIYSGLMDSLIADLIV